MRTVTGLLYPLRPALLVIISAILGSAQSPSILTVGGSRPLMKGINAIEAKAGIPINYEDPQFEYPADLQDVTDEARNPQQRAANPNTSIVVPRRAKLSLNSTLFSQQFVTQSDVFSLLIELRKVHDAQNLPGRFEIVQKGSVWTVEPSAVRSKNGTLAAASSVLNTRISLPFQERNSLECLLMVAKETSRASGTRIDVGAYPAVAFANAKLMCGSTDQPANVVLTRLFARIAAVYSAGISPLLYSYRLLYDSNVKYYLLNVNSVPSNTSNMSTTSPTTLPGRERTGFLLKDPDPKVADPTEMRNTTNFQRALRATW